MTDCHGSQAQIDFRSTIVEAAHPLIVLAGQPNMGKSTLFNLLTGMNQHVGNWPGKTIERREGHIRLDEQLINLVDLPGTYSLTANSPEEVIAREFILHAHPSLVVAVVSAANLERSLYLVAELLALEAPVMLVLNMMDVAANEGIRVDPAALEKAMGLPVIPMTASKAVGITELLEVVREILGGRCAMVPKAPEIRADHRVVLEKLEQYVISAEITEYPPSWTALKLLEGDAEITQKMQAVLPPPKWESVQNLLRSHDDAFLAVASGRYEWIEQKIQAAVTKPKIGQIGITDRIDRWAAHPIYGMIILAIILGLVFGVTFAFGTPLQRWLSGNFISPLAGLAREALRASPSWVSSLIADGVIGGVGAVLTFLPILAIFFTIFALLEDVGYMARAAYVMDNLMHLMGLHGKSFLPLFLGFGCNVPAIMGTRVIDSKPARILTILIAPLVPCTARIAVVAFLAPAFFGANALWVSWGLVLFSMLMLISSGSILNHIVFKGQHSTFIMEMPLYHIPGMRTIGVLVSQRLSSFIKKAGTTILIMSLAVWVLSYLPGGSLETSFLARLGYLLEPVGKWMGLDWRLIVALITSFPAKENAIATLGVLLRNSNGVSLASALLHTYSTASALSFLVVTMLFIPCMATVAITHQETRSWGWTLLSVFMLLAISTIAGSAVYHLAVLVGL